MDKKQHKNSTAEQLWNFFSSIRLTIFILLSIAATSVLGTVIPQNGKPDFYVHKYGTALNSIFTVFNVYDMYHSWWFQFLIACLSVNIIVCSLNRLSSSWKMIFPDKPAFKITRFSKSSIKKNLTVLKPIQDLENLYEKSVGRRFSYKTVEKHGSGIFIFAEKGRWTRLGVYAVHLSVVLLLAGSLLGSLFGFDGYVEIPEGESTDRIRLRDSERSIALDFQIRCDDFTVSHYDSGAPKEYRSALTLIEKDKIVFQKDIIVNDPLRYKGINIFQSSYNKLPPKNIRLVFSERTTGKEIFSKTAQIGEVIPLPDNRGEFILRDYHTDYHFRGHTIGEAFTGSLTLANSGSFQVLIPYPFPTVDYNKPHEISQLDMFQQHDSPEIPERLSLSFTSRETGMVYNREVAIAETVTLPEGLGQFILKNFERSYSYKGHLIGDSFTGLLIRENGGQESVILPLRFPNFDKMRQGDLIISIADIRQKESSSELVVSAADLQEWYRTGLQVTKDPGVWVVYCGFVLMILGCYITFFMSHQQVCIELAEKGKKTEVSIAGTTNKNKLGMQKVVEALSAEAVDS